LVQREEHRVMVSENRLKLSRKGHHTMAFDQSALLDLLAQFKLTDVTDRIRLATEMLYQQLIVVGRTAIGRAGMDRSLP